MRTIEDQPAPIARPNRGLPWCAMPDEPEGNRGLTTIEMRCRMVCWAWDGAS